MQNIEDRLRGLSHTARQPVAPPDAEGIWRTGRARARRRNVAAAIGVAGLACAVVLGAGALRDEGPARGEAPIATRTDDPNAFHLPAQLEARDPGDLEALPAGPVSAVLVRTDEQPLGPGGPWPGDPEPGYPDGLVAISATTGGYGVLTLPDGAQGVALSPGGTKLLYWLADPDLPDSADAQEKGWVSAHVRDLRTGEVTDVDVQTDTSVDPFSVEWLDDDTFTAALTERVGAGNVPMDPLLWRTGDTALSAWPDPSQALSKPRDSIGEGSIVAFGESGWWVLDPLTGQLLAGDAATATVTTTKVPDLGLEVGEHLQIGVSGDERWLVAYARVHTGPPSSTEVEEQLRVLDLDAPDAGWRELPVEESILRLGAGRGTGLVVTAAQGLDLESGTAQAVGWRRYMELDPATGRLTDLIDDSAGTTGEGNTGFAWVFARTVLGEAGAGEVD